MDAHYAPGQFNAARQRMATMPRGAVLIDNGRSIAPGFSMGNVHVMAGVPAIMRAMFDMLAPTLEQGTPVVSRSVHAADILEGDIAAGLTEIQGALSRARFRKLPILPRQRARRNNRRKGRGWGSGRCRHRRGWQLCSKP